MRIKSIELKNIRCFEHVKIDFGRDDEITPWTVILGDNGIGKSTLLRCIALALAPQTEYLHMITPVKDWLREEKEEGWVQITIESGEILRLLIIRDEDGRFGSMKLYPRPSLNNQEIIHTTSEEEFNTLDGKLGNSFICGYGSSRRMFGSQSFGSYTARDATSTLFDYDAKLQNPELILRRLGDRIGDTMHILALVDRVLMLPEGSTRLGMTGIEVSGPWGNYRPAESLGDGFRATLAWMLDFIGWVMYYDYTMLEREIEGIVLIDEIEQHLHPRWQRRVLKVLHEQFPKVQFIVTTHSSLCVLGTTDFDDDHISLTLLEQRDDAVVASTGLRPPRGLRADQILTSPLFGLETTSDDATKYQIERLSNLLSQPTHTSNDKREIAKLRAELDDKLGSEETALERDVASAVTEVLRQPGRLHEPNIPDEVIDLEVRRQLQALYSDV